MKSKKVEELLERCKLYLNWQKLAPVIHFISTVGSLWYTTGVVFTVVLRPSFIIHHPFFVLCHLCPP